MAGEFLVFDHVTKRFGALTAVDDVSFSIQKGEFFSLLGPSGCGKTTLLRMVGGFERPDSGRIYLDGKDITDAPPNMRRVHTVFQNYALFPTMTIWDNIAFSLRLAKKPKAEIEEACKKLHGYFYKEPDVQIILKERQEMYQMEEGTRYSVDKKGNRLLNYQGD